MRALVYERHGGVEELKLVKQPDPELSPHRVLVGVHSIGLNPLDYRIRNGALGPLAKLSKARLTGSDFAGTVLEVGHRVRGVEVGDQVIGMTFQPLAGTSAERITVNPKVLARCPSNLDLSAAATVPLAALTAYQALHHIGGIQPGQHVLVNGASGGVGTFATQLAKSAGAEVTAVTSHRNTDWMNELGADHTLDYEQVDCCRGDACYDIFFDCYGNRSFPKARQVLTRSGRYINTIPGPRAYKWTLANPLRRQTSHVVVVRSRRADLEAICDLIEGDRLRPIVQQVYPLEQAQEAYRALESKRTRGKLAIRIAR